MSVLPARCPSQHSVPGRTTAPHHRPAPPWLQGDSRCHQASVGWPLGMVFLSPFPSVPKPQLTLKLSRTHSHDDDGHGQGGSL